MAFVAHLQLVLQRNCGAPQSTAKLIAFKKHVGLEAYLLRSSGGVLSRVHTLVDTIIRLQRRSQTDVSERSGVHPSNLSKFLNGDTDIRSSSLKEILRAVGVNLESILEKEIDVLIGKKRTDNVGQALEVLLGHSDPMTARTILETLSKRSKNETNPAVTEALSVVNGYKSKLKSARKN